MTESSRRSHIQEALKQYAEAKGNRDTYRAPLRGGLTLEVIDLPLHVPVLNVESFRIAPQLADHPKADFVRANPETPEAQAIIADLIRSVHRNVTDLKQNLEDEGQGTPGLITRAGVLINGNTRCVLLRDLYQEGRTDVSTIQVAVLPPNVGNLEELEIEMVLQQQRELKDEYRLLSELLMIKTLHDNDMTDEAIGKRRRLRTSKNQTPGQKVKERREILMLMERARRLFDPPQPLTAFDTKVDKLEIWSALLSQVHQIDASKGSEAGDRHIQSWLLAYMSGVDSVHKLRHAVGARVERQIVAGLLDNQSVKDLLEDELGGSDAATHQDSDDDPAGLDVLGGMNAATPTNGTDDTVKGLLSIVAKARDAGDHGALGSADGRQHGAKDVLSTFKNTVERARKEQERRSASGGHLSRPTAELRKAITALKNAIDALDEVRYDTEFEDQRVMAVHLATEVCQLAASALDASKHAADAGELDSVEQ